MPPLGLGESCEEDLAHVVLQKESLVLREGTDICSRVNMPLRQDITIKQRRNPHGSSCAEGDESSVKKLVDVR